MGNIWKTMLKGLAAVLPVLITLYVVYWVASTMELLLGGFLKFIVPDAIYFPGLGVIFGLVLLYFAGVFLDRGGVLEKLYEFFEHQLEKVPLVKSLYGGLRDLMRFFSPDKTDQSDAQKVVLITLNDDTRLLGFVTGKVAAQITNSIEGEETVAVYMPMSYQIGGFTVYVPRSRIKAMDMGIEEAMKIVLTGGVGNAE